MILHMGPLARLSLEVERGEWAVERFGHCHIPCIVAGEAAPQFPYAVRERSKREQLDLN